MPILYNDFEKLIFHQLREISRLTQDSPVYPDVWIEYYNAIIQNRKKKTAAELVRIDLILTPFTNTSANELLRNLRERLTDAAKRDNENHAKLPVWRLATTGEAIAANLSVNELVHYVLPLTNWYEKFTKNDDFDSSRQLAWLKNLVGCLVELQDHPEEDQKKKKKNEDIYVQFEKWTHLFNKQFPDFLNKSKLPSASIYSVSRNRPAKICLYDSVPSTKADASRKLFNISGSRIAWAVLDTGIDARHQAFAVKDETKDTKKSDSKAVQKDKMIKSRIIATYDFTKFRELMTQIDQLSDESSGTDFQGKFAELFDKRGVIGDKSLQWEEKFQNISTIEKALRSGRMLDWSLLAPLLRIPHTKGTYTPPEHPHGTHVAGIIGAGYNEDLVKGKELCGMCPDIGLYDIRVLDKNGAGLEFNILAAIQFVRWLNNQNDQFVIHGANLSLSMLHDVKNYACGYTPICQACIRMIAEGTVVVAAAGNLGQSVYTSADNVSEQGFRTVSITDPGNAEGVITVGATHKSMPHTYGVSYFSSRGPTGDGRYKPDLVAPGEKILSPVLDNGYDLMDGSSMAAPHVSGAAALLMAKHRELIGQPLRVKEILCKNATDLGRERYFQGYGMVDVLRALQSV